MKNLLIIALGSLIIASCGDSGTSDKQSELDQLVMQQAELNDKILKLREEIQSESGDNSGIKLVASESIKPILFRHYVEVQAKVDGDEIVTVGARTQGTVNSILVNQGDKVSEGQILATLDDQIIRQTYAEVKTQYNFANNIYMKQKNLWDQKIGSEIQYLTAKNNKESLRKRLSSINEQIDLTRIKSPVSGTVDNIPIKVGQALAPGMPAATIVNMTSLKVKGEVGESYSGRINIGDPVVLHFPDLGREVVSSVGFASKAINTLNRTFNVEVPLADADVEKMSPNMVVVMKISDYTNENAFVVPVDLIQRSGEGNYIMVALQKKGKLIASRKKVETGMVYNGQAEILSGITESDQIITQGYRDLNEGQIIRTK